MTKKRIETGFDRFFAEKMSVPKWAAGYWRARSLIDRAEALGRNKLIGDDTVKTLAQVIAAAEEPGAGGSRLDKDLLAWIQDNRVESFQTAWATLQRADWMVELAGRCEIDLDWMLLERTTAACVRQVLPLWVKKNPDDDRLAVTMAAIDAYCANPSADSLAEVEDVNLNNLSDVQSEIEEEDEQDKPVNQVVYAMSHLVEALVDWENQPNQAGEALALALYSAAEAGGARGKGSKGIKEEQEREQRWQANELRSLMRGNAATELPTV